MANHAVGGDAQSRHVERDHQRRDDKREVEVKRGNREDRGRQREKVAYARDLAYFDRKQGQRMIASAGVGGAGVFCFFPLVHSVCSLVAKRIDYRCIRRGNQAVVVMELY